MASPRVLILDADATRRGELGRSLRGEGFEVLEASAAEAALGTILTARVDAVLCVRAGAWSCAAVVAMARERGSEAAFVAGCCRETVAAGVEAVRHGAESFVVLPDVPGRVALALQRALETRRLRRESRELREEARTRLRWVGSGPEATAIQEVIRRAAPTKATVLLLGEPGTGRSFASELIHEASPRRDRPFVRVPCAGIAEGVLDVLLFGSDVPAWGSQEKRAEGLIDRAQGGTLYLQEVGSLGPALQVKLLRLLQQGEFERAGGTESLRADVRVVASTRLDLAAEVHAGRFRDDLYYRLNVVSLQLTPLRTRKADLPALAAHFLACRGRSGGRAERGITPGALSALFAYDWPGNVRELERVITQAVEGCRGDAVGLDDLPVVLRTVRPDEGAGIALIPGASLFEIEREAILRTLDAVGGTTARAAEVLGVSVRKVQYRLKEYRTGRSHSRVRGGDR